MMNMITLLTGLNRENGLHAPRTTFQPGQILNGKIIKLFPNNIASLNIGSQKVVAQLEASLDVQQRYWFQVQPGNGHIKLKVIARGVMDAPSSQAEISILSLMESLSIPNKGTRLEVLKYFLKEQLPINKEVIEKSAELLKTVKAQQNGFDAIKLLLQKQLPLTLETVNAMVAVLDEASLSKTIENVIALLQKEPPSDTRAKLALLLKEYVHSTHKIEQEMLVFKAGKQDVTPGLVQTSSIAEGLVKLIHRMGYSYENSLLQLLHNDKKNPDTMKPLLMNLLKEIGAEPLKTAVEKLLNKLTGVQLLSHELSPMQHQVVQIPLFFQNQNLDLTVQWSGKKTDNDEIDPDYCRIVFFLELANLGDTLIDMNVQNRIVSLTVMNNNEELKSIAQPLIPLLKESLHSVHYTLSTVHFNPFIHSHKKPSINMMAGSAYSGVDLRI
ncbi:hypothetical protein [Niallia sp. Krafla_26]|uniref:hypothetical protein n=1 Tax=Niallia sp. Krafla_26 TaxID=3064703 RepID=UPI003D184EDD